MTTDAAADSRSNPPSRWPWTVAVALAWSDAWSNLAGPDDGDRRREEYRAHLADALAAGRAGSRLLAEAVRGSVDDVRWCNESRTARGRLPLGHVVLAESSAAGAAMAALMVVVYVLSLYHPAGPIRASVLALAGGLLVVTVARSLAHRFAPGRGRRSHP